MYAALLAKDAAWDGVFFAGVSTTGVLCRPVCPARKPRRENVVFFADAEAGLRAGYRPCRRCDPLGMGRRPPAWVGRLLALAERAPAGRVTEADLRAAGIEPRRARRWFSEHRGTTFHAWARARRLRGALRAVREGGGVLGVGLDHGWESASGFSAAFSRTFGRPPGGGRAVACLVARWVATPLGRMLAVAGEDGLRVLAFHDRGTARGALAAASRTAGLPVLVGDHATLDALERELSEWFAGSRTRFSVPLAPRGTPFERAVWDRLAEIPYGETTSYARVAADVGRPAAPRAVGRANGRNPLAIVVPCHRVVRADGALCGYGGGVWRKRRLLEHERRVLAARTEAVSAGTERARGLPRGAP
jgi:AraC family transcriptional regulator of adaptative response/methylated-DNA-[protein]-cysteine methyltransferase